MSHVHPVPEIVSGLASTKVLARCLAPHPVTDYLATSDAQKLCPVAINAPVSVARTALSIVVRTAA